MEDKLVEAAKESEGSLLSDKHNHMARRMGDIYLYNLFSYSSITKSNEL